MDDAAAIAAPAAAVSPVMDKQKRERRFYTRMAFLLLAFVFVGFAPTYYLKSFDVVHFPRPAPPLSPTLMLHGAVFTIWTLLFVVQTQLVSAGRRDLHRTLGIAGFAIGVLMLPLMYLAVLDQVERGVVPPFTDVLTWTAVPLAPFPIYALLLWLGWTARRRDLQSHKRYMLSFMILISQPATTRLPLLPPTVIGFSAQLLLSALVFIPMIVWDRRSIGKVHNATWTGLGLCIVGTVVQAFFLLTPGIWSSFAALLPGMVR